MLESIFSWFQFQTPFEQSNSSPPFQESIMVPCGRKCSFWLAFFFLTCILIAALRKASQLYLWTDHTGSRKTLKEERLIKKHFLHVPQKVNLSSCIGCIRIINAGILFNDVFCPSVSHVSFSEGCWAVVPMVTLSEIVPHLKRPYTSNSQIVSFNFFFK